MVSIQRGLARCVRKRPSFWLSSKHTTRLDGTGLKRYSEPGWLLSLERSYLHIFVPKPGVLAQGPRYWAREFTCLCTCANGTTCAVFNNGEWLGMRAMTDSQSACVAAHQ